MKPPLADSSSIPTISAKRAGNGRQWDHRHSQISNVMLIISSCVWKLAYGILSNRDTPDEVEDEQSITRREKGSLEKRANEFQIKPFRNVGWN